MLMCRSVCAVCVPWRRIPHSTLPPIRTSHDERTNETSELSSRPSIPHHPYLHRHLHLQPPTPPPPPPPSAYPNRDTIRKTHISISSFVSLAMLPACTPLSNMVFVGRWTNAAMITERRNTSQIPRFRMFCSKHPCFSLSGVAWYTLLPPHLTFIF
jgi:hypothetical protein